MIIIIACAETDGEDKNSLMTPSENARRNLINCISHGNIDIPLNEDELDIYKGINEQFSYDDQDDTRNQDCTLAIQNWIFNIKISAIEQSKVVGDRINALYCPELVTSLLRICNEFPLWSAVMVSYFNSPNQTATSARVEGYFSTLKSSILAKKVPKMRVDKFLVTHIRSIRGDIKLVACNKNDNFTNYLPLVNETNLNIKSVSEEEKTNTTKINIDNDPELLEYDNIILSDTSDIIENNDNSLEEDRKSNSCSSLIMEELQIENWKNKARQPSPLKKESKRSKYLNSHPEIKIKQKRNKNILRRLDIAKNGNLIKPLTIGLEKIKNSNTCAFDSILQAIATAYIDSQEYAHFVDKSQCPTLNIASALVKNGAIKKFYEERLVILKEYCKRTTLVGKIIEYDARANVATLAEKLFLRVPSIYQYYTCDNYKCGQTINNIPLFPIDQEKLIKGSSLFPILLFSKFILTNIIYIIFF